MSFVAIRTSDYEPRYFIRTDKSISALCTDKCVFNSLQHQQFLNSWQNSHFQKSDFMFYKLPDNYSILGKTPLEFLIQTQGYKPPERSGFCAKQKRRFRDETPKKKTVENKSPDLFSDLGENRQLQHSKMEKEIGEFDIF